MVKSFKNPGCILTSSYYYDILLCLLLTGQKGVVLLGWMARVNWADVIAIIIVLRSTYVGSQRGFFGELFYIFGILFTIILSLHLYGNLGNFINRYLFIPLNISNLISFLIIIFILYVGFRFLYGFIQKVIKIEILPAINRIGGPLLGFCKGFVMATILYFLMLLIPITYITDSAKTKSFFGPFFIKTGTILYEKGINLIPVVESKDLTQLLSGAKPLKFGTFRLKRKDKMDEVLQ